MKKIYAYNTVWMAIYLLPLTLFAEINIQKIELNPTENQISFTCAFELSDTLTPSEKIIDYSIKSITNNTDTADLVILSTELTNGNTIELLAQAALNDAIYTTTQRDFIVEYNINETTYKAQRKAVLSGFFQVFDLRPYTSTFISKVGKQSILFCLFILLFLMMSIPLHYKFFFKRNNIKKYKEVKNDFEDSDDPDNANEPCDPYTYEPFQDEHDVVVIKDKILLLETWKTLSENDEVKSNPEFSYLFAKKESGHFFKPASKMYQYMHNAWFGFLSGTLAFLLFQLSLSIDLNILKNHVANIFDDRLQISSLLVEATLLGACFGICYFTITTVAVLPWKILPKPMLNILKNSILGTILSSLIFFEATLISTYFQSFINVCIAWLFMGLNLGLLIAFLNHKHWMSGLTKGLFAGAVGFIIYLSGYYLISYFLFNATSLFVWNLSFFGGLLAAGTYQNQASLKPENEIEPEAETAVLSDLSKPSLQEKL